LDWAKKHVQKECQSNLEHRVVKFDIEYGLNIMYTNMCLKDKRNEYCSINRLFYSKSHCDECVPTFAETVKNVMKDAPVEQTEKTLKRWNNAPICNKQKRNTIKKIMTNEGTSARFQTFVSHIGTLITLGYAVFR
jgi:hypothetical protein